MRFIAFFVIIILFLSSCSKKDEPINNNTPKPDTLANGWSKVNISGAGTFYEICFINNSVGYAVGDNNLFRSADGGNSWTPLSFFSGRTNIAGTSDDKIFGAGAHNGLYASFDQGATTITKSFGKSVCDVYFTNKDSGYAIGSDSLYQTVDGGNKWSGVITPGVVLSPEYNSLYFINNVTGWIANRTQVYRTNGSLNNWELCNFDASINGLRFSFCAISPKIVYACSSGNGMKVFKSIDGGKNFTTLKSFNEPTIISGSYGDIQFFSNGVGYVSNDRLIYKTQDDGLSWQVVVKLGQGYIQEIYFTDINHGWACGDDTSRLVLIYKQ